MNWDIDIRLLPAMKESVLDPYIQLVLTQGVTSYTYYLAHILEIDPHTEQPFSHTAKVVLDNSYGALTDIDLQGFEAVISYGLYIETLGYPLIAATAPLWVIGQQFNSSEGVLDCTLEMIGIPNLMAEDKASESYLPDAEDTKTIKTLLIEILTATLPCFSHCKAYQITYWGAGTGAGSLMNTYIPKDKFRIYLGDSRLAKVRELIDNTKCVIKFRAEGKIHIFEPVVSGETYDYEYSLTGEDAHTFFAKALRKRLVIPNKIVVQDDDEEPTYSGSAVDQPSIDALEGQEFRRTFIRALDDDDQGDEIAESILSKYRMHAEAGAANVPMNVCSEVFDFVNVTDERENDSRAGNIGSLTRIWKQGQYELRFSFGGWLSVRNLLTDFETYEGTYFSRLQVKHAYIENLLVGQIDAVWIDPEGNVDLSLIGDNLDSLPDGEVYARVKSLHMDAGQIKLDEHVLYKSGYDPSGKLPYGTTLDSIAEGTVYQRVRTTDIQSGHIKLSSQTVIVGEWYSESGVTIDATKGILIEGEGVFAIAEDVGHFVNGWIEAVGNQFKISGQVGKEIVIVSREDLTLASTGANIRLQPWGGNVYLTGNLSLSGTGKVLIPSAGRLRIPVGTNRYG